MHRLEDISKNDRTVLTVAAQLGHFMTARIELIELYPLLQTNFTTTRGGKKKREKSEMFYTVLYMYWPFKLISYLLC